MINAGNNLLIGVIKYPNDRMEFIWYNVEDRISFTTVDRHPSMFIMQKVRKEGEPKYVNVELVVCMAYIIDKDNAVTGAYVGKIGQHGNKLGGTDISKVNTSELN